LYGSDPAREGEAQLTFGDCNAYDPAWLDATRLVYVSDCGRGAGMGALAEINIGMDTGKREGAAADAARISRAQGESQE
jgi:nitrous oxide reductase accessory protein NosL